jgi:hypothetical protein
LAPPDRNQSTIPVEGAGAELTRRLCSGTPCAPSRCSFLRHWRPMASLSPPMPARAMGLTKSSPLNAEAPGADPDRQRRGLRLPFSAAGRRRLCDGRDQWQFHPVDRKGRGARVRAEGHAIGRCRQILSAEAPLVDGPRPRARPWRFDGAGVRRAAVKAETDPWRARRPSIPLG